MAEAYGMWPLNVCQIGREATPGTAVAATTIWRGPFGGWDDDRQTEEIAEDVGTFGFTERTVDTFYGAKIPFPSAVAHYEQLLYLHSGSVGEVAPTGSSPYIYSYAASLGDTPNTLKAHTLRVGNKQVSSDLGLFTRAYPMEWELSGNQKETWKISGTWTAPRKESGSFTAGLSLPSWNPMVFGKSKLYIDAEGGTIGTTQKTGVLMGFSLKYDPQLEWVPVGDGNLYAIAYKISRPVITFTLTLEVEENSGVSAVAVQRAAYEAKTIQQFRISCTDSANLNMVMDFAGQYTKVGAYQKSGNNNTTCQFEGKVLYSSTAALFYENVITCGLSAIT